MECLSRAAAGCNELVRGGLPDADGGDVVVVVMMKNSRFGWANGAVGDLLRQRGVNF